jgi:hypothetical protein
MGMFTFVMIATNATQSVYVRFNSSNNSILVLLAEVESSNHLHSTPFLVPEIPAVFQNRTQAPDFIPTDLLRPTVSKCTAVPFVIPTAIFAMQQHVWNRKAPTIYSSIPVDNMD